MPSSLPRRVTIHPSVLFRELDQELVLIDLRDDRCFSLDSVGGRIWQLLAAGSEVPAIAEQLRAEYDVSDAELSRGLAELLDRLADAGLVTVEP
jgi:hypothetical protein